MPDELRNYDTKTLIVMLDAALAERARSTLAIRRLRAAIAKRPKP